MSDGKDRIVISFDFPESSAKAFFNRLRREPGVAPHVFCGYRPDVRKVEVELGYAADLDAFADALSETLVDEVLPIVVPIVARYPFRTEIRVVGPRIVRSASLDEIVLGLTAEVAKEIRARTAGEA